MRPASSLDADGGRPWLARSLTNRRLAEIWAIKARTRTMINRTLAKQLGAQDSHSVAPGRYATIAQSTFENNHHCDAREIALLGAIIGQSSVELAAPLDQRLGPKWLCPYAPQCATRAPRPQRVAELWPSPRRICQNWTKSGRRWSNLVEFGMTSTNIGECWPGVGQLWGNVWPHSANVGPVPPTSTASGPSSGDVGADSTKVGPS